jgi:hypothetical protein
MLNPKFAGSVKRKLSNAEAESVMQNQMQGTIDDFRETIEGNLGALPHLISYGTLQRCSVCGYPFPTDVKPSMDGAFVEHLAKAHRPDQLSEAFTPTVGAS